jgi:hypothetical protein
MAQDQGKLAVVRATLKDSCQRVEEQRNEIGDLRKQLCEVREQAAASIRESALKAKEVRTLAQPVSRRSASCVRRTSHFSH